MYGVVPKSKKDTHYPLGPNVIKTLTEAESKEISQLVQKHLEERRVQKLRAGLQQKKKERIRKKKEREIAKARRREVERSAALKSFTTHAIANMVTVMLRRLTNIKNVQAGSLLLSLFRQFLPTDQREDIDCIIIDLKKDSREMLSENRYRFYIEVIQIGQAARTIVSILWALVRKFLLKVVPFYTEISRFFFGKD